jgi:hypothetical protein
MKKWHISPPAFLVAFCCTYAGLLAKNWPLFLYYPLHGDFFWGHQLAKGIGPAMAWYGLMASAGLVALGVSICVPPRLSAALFRNYLWIFPIAAMLIAVFVLRRLFF